MPKLKHIYTTNISSCLNTHYIHNFLKDRKITQTWFKNGMLLSTRSQMGAFGHKRKQTDSIGND